MTTQHNRWAAISFAAFFILSIVLWAMTGPFPVSISTKKFTVVQTQMFADPIFGQHEIIPAWMTVFANNIGDVFDPVAFVINSDYAIEKGDELTIQYGNLLTIERWYGSEKHRIQINGRRSIQKYQPEKGKGFEVVGRRDKLP